MIGGFGEPCEVDEDVRAVFNMAVKPRYSQNAAIEIHQCKCQVVAGTNYHFHYTVDGDKKSCCVYKPLPHTNEGPQLTFEEDGWNDARGH